ncbi:cytochrome P450 3A29-like [Oppia nitens]|uniref:cytochrome P450 3A29-like n=1 Tax=Oppia nitens TaxID=1686743 RepID=UPI0023D9B1DE|nr:cytochrome P450 3A29-like [Oppia nitens]
MDFLTVVLIAVSLILFLLYRRFTYWSRRGVVGPKFIEMGGFFTNHHNFTKTQYEKYGPIYGSFSFDRKAICINDPDLLRDIMVRDFHIFPDHKHFHFGSSKIDKSLFFMPGNDDWKRVRSILSPTFTSGKLRAMMSHISDISDKFVESLSDYEKKGEPVDMRKYIGAFAMDVISACAYGINVESVKNPNHPIVTNAKKILGVDANIQALVSVLFPPLGKLLNCEPFDVNAVQYFDDLTNQILKERKARNKYGINDKLKRRTDFIQLMIDSEKTNKDLGYDSNSDVDIDESNEQTKQTKPIGTLTPDELTAQGILFFIAGYDTTSAALTHAIYYLSQNKESQQKLYEEIKTVDEFTYEKLVHLKYLNAVINETLRLAPSLTRIQRECLQDYKLGNTGITIPAGCSVEILPYAIHRDPKLWPEPEKFKPERFIDSTHHPFAFIPFGGGPRICIGQRFALNEMRMCLAKLIHRFEFTLPDNSKQMEYFKGSILMSPKELAVNLKARQISTRL